MHELTPNKSCVFAVTVELWPDGCFHSRDRTLYVTAVNMAQAVEKAQKFLKNQPILYNEQFVVSKVELQICDLVN